MRYPNRLIARFRFCTTACLLIVWVTTSRGQVAGWWPQCGCSEPIGSDIITSPFGPRYLEYHYDYHDGMDISMPFLNPVHATWDGTVAFAQRYDNVGWVIKIQSVGAPTISGNVQDVLTAYVHLDSKNVNVNDVVVRGQSIGLCGNYGTGPHVHLSPRPGYWDETGRAHPVRFLTKTDISCPQFALGWSVVGSGGIDYLLCTSQSEKVERYDLGSIIVYIYTSTEFRKASINFEHYYQMLYEGGPDFTLFQGTDFEVKVTLQPHTLNPSEAYHKIDIKVDPKRFLPSLGYLGVSLEDVYNQYDCKDYPGSSIGNVTEQSPGTLVERFVGTRVGDDIKLDWCGSADVNAVGVRLFRSTDGSAEQAIHERLLPFRGTGGDTPVFVDRDVGLTADLVYRLSVTLGNGMSIFSDQVVRIPASVGQSDVPVSLNLGQNFPNPFNASTQISFSIDAASVGPVKIQVLDILGRPVATAFSSDNAAPGRYTCEWDCRDSHGQPVASGIYFYRLDTKNRHVSRKMVLLK